MSGISPKQLFQTGVLNGTIPVLVDIGSNGLSGVYPGPGTYQGAVEVTINAGFIYTYTNPEWITPPFWHVCETPFGPGVSFGPGAMLKLLQPEAAALVAAGAATINAYL